MNKLLTVSDFQKLPSTLAFSSPDFSPPTKGEVRSLIQFLGWSHLDVHKHIGVSYNETKKMSSTVSSWVGGDQQEVSKIPYSAWLSLLLFAGVVQVTDIAAQI